MRIIVTYVHHNCFFLDTGERLVLFDLPGPDQRPEGAADIVAREVRGRRLDAIFSHSHGDHFDPAAARTVAEAAEVHWIASWDVDEMFPDALPESAHFLEPEQTATIDGIMVSAIEANDLGCAFMLSFEGLRVYYGGDLADWRWPGQGDAEAAFTRQFFENAVERVQDFAPHVAFANVDPRLDNLAGGAEFAARVAPNLFVPMHTFGRNETLDDLSRRLHQSPPTIFAYHNPGDKAEFTI